MFRKSLVVSVITLFTATATAAPPDGLTPEATVAPDASSPGATGDADAPSTEPAAALDAPPPEETATEPSVNTPLREPQDPGSDARPWAVFVSGGFQFGLMENTPLGRQLRAAGYGVDAVGPAFALTVQRCTIDELHLASARSFTCQG